MKTRRVLSLLALLLAGAAAAAPADTLLTWRRDADDFTFGTQILPDGTEYKVRDELRSVEEKPAPEGTYDLPAGYRLVKAWETAAPPS